VLGIYAAFIGPFPGFVASGFKRAYGVKDFAKTFPGHGGFVDRLDCQILNFVFCSLLVSQFIYRQEMNIDFIVQAYENQLGPEHQA